MSAEAHGNPSHSNRPVPGYDQRVEAAQRSGWIFQGRLDYFHIHAGGVRHAGKLICKHRMHAACASANARHLPGPQPDSLAMLLPQFDAAAKRFTVVAYRTLCCRIAVQIILLLWRCIAFCPAHFGQHVGQQMPQRAEVIQRYRVVCRQAVLLPDLTKELGLADAVDPQIGLQIGVHFHDLARITRLLDHKVNEKRLQFLGHNRSSKSFGGW